MICFQSCSVRFIIVSNTLRKRCFGRGISVCFMDTGWTCVHCIDMGYIHIVQAKVLCEYIAASKLGSSC